MKRFWASIPLLILALSISGCVQGGGGLAGLMGMGVEEKEAPHDLLSVSNLKVIPTPPVSADSSFTLSFRVKNLDDKKSARGSRVELYDWGRCNPPDKKTKNWGSLYPGATKLIKWEFRAPTNEELGYMSGQCPLRFKVSYSFDAHTRADAIVASTERMKEASRTGKKISVSPQETKSRGPLKIDVRFGSSQPFKENYVVPFDVIVYDKGSGEPSRIENNDLSISITPEPDSFDQWDDCVYPNKGQGERLPFLEKETPPIRCTFKPQDIGSPLKTYTVKVDIANFQYQLFKKTIVSVVTTYERPEEEGVGEEGGVEPPLGTSEEGTEGSEGGVEPPI